VFGNPVVDAAVLTSSLDLVCAQPHAREAGANASARGDADAFARKTPCDGPERARADADAAVDARLRRVTRAWLSRATHASTAANRRSLGARSGAVRKAQSSDTTATSRRCTGGGAVERREESAVIRHDCGQWSLHQRRGRARESDESVARPTLVSQSKDGNWRVD